MRSPSQGTPARPDHAPHYLRGERLLGGSRLVGEIEDGVGSLSHCSRQRPQGSAQASKTCSQLSTRTACPDPRRIREAHRSSRTRHAGDAERTRHGGRDVRRGVSSTSHTSPTPASRLGAGPSSTSSRIVPTPPGPARITKRELFSDSPIPSSSRVRPTGGVRDSQGLVLRASLPEPRFVKRSWPSEG
jgi:hypothetical protein